MRLEVDFIGEKLMDENALYGIHSLRAKENFPDISLFHLEWYKAIGRVKLACYKTYLQYKKALEKEHLTNSISFQLIDDNTIETLSLVAEEISEGKYFEHFIVPAISGGAGTSINMNVNEIIANACLVKLNKKPGQYDVVDPIEHANVFQSTNDVIPTSLKLTVLVLLTKLEKSINSLRSQIENIEKQSFNKLRIAYTQMQEAVPSSYGKLFSAYNEALSRDWWRVSKCFERIKVVNLGGSAIGTGITVPQYFIMNVVNQLQKLSNLPITRSENLSDATNNLDTFVEVHAIIKSHAVNLEKMVSDIRLLASDLIKDKEINIPNKQVGSSIMPAKVNPVIPEFVVSCCHKIYANDAIVTSLSAAGCLDLNAYIPTIGHAIIESLKLMIACDQTLNDNLFSGLTINAELALEKLFYSPSISTALVPYIGYNKASLISKEMKTNNISIFAANEKLKLVSKEKLQKILTSENLLKTGFTIKDL
jgi:aspartate ammonia-lyase